MIVTEPTVDDLLDYAGISTYDRDEAQSVLDAVLSAQAARCVTSPYVAPLRLAALRHATAVLTAKGAPLGVQDLGTFGGVTLPRFDSVVEDLEANYLRGAFA